MDFPNFSKIKKMLVTFRNFEHPLTFLGIMRVYRKQTDRQTDRKVDIYIQDTLDTFPFLFIQIMY